MKTKSLVLLPMILVLIVLFYEHADAQYRVLHSVCGCGGAVLSNGTYHTGTTVGQAMIGVVSNRSHINEVGFWYQSIELSTGVEQISYSLPTEYRLEQNYPNPFNPGTIISYDMPKPGFSRLAIYDMLGRNVKTLINRHQPAGHFQVTWDGANDHNLPVAAGLYFCRLEVGEYSKAIKMSRLR